MALILVTQNIPRVGIKALEDAGHEVVVGATDRVLKKEELIALLNERQYDAILALLTDTIDAEVLVAAPKLKVVANYAVGTNNIDVTAAKERAVVISNTPGVLTDTVAEFALSLMLATVKRIPEADRYTRAGKFKSWGAELMLGSDLKGKTLGILGAGRIGAGVAVRAQKGFGMNVVYYDVQPVPALESEITCTYLGSVEELLRVSDVVSIHVPLLPSTQHLLNRERLAMMKSTAYLINTSRGPVIDEAALVDALKRGVIRGAGLDVFENEPALTDGLADLESVVITPHIASASVETRDQMALMAVANILAVLQGNPAVNPVF
ncbi:MAG: D-glycerate dehydrogenase [Candidatus Pacebacteria bacterium]|nr:D-glycerate dehydrogenase [Candidatus Paceibacterota bacterium]MBP9842749.1 D-glycerate dehydrogenase [Candidatus Paceibacterota bacterium]